MGPYHEPRLRGEHEDADRGAPWLEAFHRGDRAVIERCYREHFTGVERAVGTLLRGADRETVVHEVFSRLIARAELRRSFRGGALGAWLATIARNQAIDYHRRLAKERPFGSGDDETLKVAAWEEATQARLAIDRFRRSRLRPEWVPVFELRFVQQLSQHAAARALGLSRTTLAYRELRIRRDLRHFVLEGEEP
jgi:RNA polymerase sigma-70 factor (ECF subfamily)